MSNNFGSVTKRGYPIFGDDDQQEVGHGPCGGTIKPKRHSLEGHGPAVSLSSAPGKRLSSSSSCPSPGGGGSWSGGGVLGEGFQAPTLSRRWLRSLSGGLTLKSNSSGDRVEQRRNPRPTKTRLTLERLRNGLRGCVSLAEDELSDVKSSLSDLSLNSANQAYQGCGRWLKGLEYALSLVESLALEYERLVEMREGVRSMAYAFSVSVGPQRESALVNVKAGFRECTIALCELETKLQKLLGVFHMEIKGIQGFSRLCGGDVFEISLRHGRQKWKSRGRVGKDGRQTWDVPKASFRGVLDEVIQIKAAEMKTLGKEMLLGNKFCEITELFSPEPQLMTVNLNPSGSLKLNLLVTWWPLGTEEDGPETLGFGSSLSISPNRKRRAVRQDSASDSSHGSNTSTLSSTHSVEEEQQPQREATLWERSLRALTEEELMKPPPNRESSSSSSGEIRDKNTVDPTGNFILGNGSTTITVSTVEDDNVLDFDDEEEETEVDGGTGSCENVEAATEGKSLRISILRLAALLEDIQGHFPELEPLHTHTKTLQRLLKAPSFHSSNSSLNVESALECFDFLDSEEIKSEKGTIKSLKKPPRPESAKITDSGIFLANSESPTPSAASCDDEGRLLGEPWDSVLEAHVSSCLKLIHKLGSFGPLRFREKEALRKLQRHSALIGIVLSHLPDRLSTEEFVSPTVGPIWFRLAGYRLLITGEEAIEGLMAEVRKILKVKGNGSIELSQRISQVLVGQMMETKEVRPGDKLTRFQMESFLKHTTLEDAVEEIVEEETLLESLQNSLEDGVKELLPSRVPPKTVLVYLFRSLTESVSSEVLKFLEELGAVASRKRQVEEIVAELLESEEAIERRAGIAGVHFLGLTSYVGALSYLAQMDKDAAVRKTAEEGLRKLGGEGEMSPHGIRGLGLA